MSFRPFTFSLISLTIILLLLGSCDSQLTENDPEAEIQMTETPITYVSNSAKITTKTLQEVTNPASYYCLVSTLNPEEQEWAYRIERFDVTIPKGLVKQAQKEGKDKKWVTYQFADKYALARTNADTLDGGGLVRMARCRLPATPNVINAVKHQLTKFKQTTWVHDNKSQERARSSKGKQGPVQSGWEYGCTKIIKYYLCPPGTQNPESNPECTFLFSECYEYGLRYVEEDEEPGGGGSSDDGGPCEPCVNEPGGPQGFCSSQPSGNDGVPEGCAVEEEIEIIEPCDTNGEYPVLEDAGVNGKMLENWTESFGSTSNGLPDGQRNEAMFMVLATSSGYEIEELPGGPGTSSCKFNFNGSIPSNVVAIIHTHPYGDGDPVNDPRCPSGKIYDGNEVSDGDRNLAHQISNSSILPPTPIYVMDKDKIRVIASSDSTNYSDTINRCGY